MFTDFFIKLLNLYFRRASFVRKILVTFPFLPYYHIIKWITLLMSLFLWLPNFCGIANSLSSHFSGVIRIHWGWCWIKSSITALENLGCLFYVKCFMFDVTRSICSSISIWGGKSCSPCQTIGFLSKNVPLIKTK